MIFVLAILFIAPFTVFAADSWNETPALNHENELGLTEPARLKHVNPSIEMLAETPDLLSGNNDKDTLVHNSSNKADVFNPEQYIETPAF
jgi:hypothetical protein